MNRKSWKQGPDGWFKNYYLLKEFQLRTGKHRPTAVENQWLHSWCSSQHSRDVSGLLEDYQKKHWDLLPVPYRQRTAKYQTEGDLRGEIHALGKDIVAMRKLLSRDKNNIMELMADMGELLIILEEHKIELPEHIREWGL